MNKKLRWNLIIILMSAFALIFGSISLSMAWFSINKKVESNGFYMQAGGKSDVDIYSAYVLSYNDNEGIYNYHDYRTMEGDLVMSSYDTIFTDKNDHTSLILKITLNGVDPSGGIMRFAFKSDKSTNYYIDGTTKVDPKLSNVISISGKVSTHVDIDADSAANAYNDSLARLQDATYYSFVVESTNTHELEFNVPYSPENIVDDKVTFDIVIKYSDTLVGLYHKSYGDFFDTELIGDLLSLTIS